MIGTINFEVAFLYLKFLSDWERRKQFREIKEINLGQKTCNVGKIISWFLAIYFRVNYAIKVDHDCGLVHFYVAFGWE